MQDFMLFRNSAQREDSGACELHKILSTGNTLYPLTRRTLYNGTIVINLVIGGYRTTLHTICTDDFDWKSPEGLPQDAIDKTKRLSAHFPAFVGDYKNGCAEMS